MNMWKILYIEMRDCNLYIKEIKGKMKNNSVEPW